MTTTVHIGNRKQGFTLIELLVVMAITVILIGLIFGPLVQGFNLTNRARVQVLSQDTARRLMEIGQRDLANSVFVFDNVGQPLNFWVKDPDGNPLAVPVNFASADMVPPVRYIDQQGYSFLQSHPELYDPTTGEALENPELGNALRRIGAAEGDSGKYLWLANTAVPTAPGRSILRYWMGLRDNTSNSGVPTHPYVNFYDAPRLSSVSDHNPFVLYRAMVSPYLPSGQVDQRFFRVDSQGRPILYDANFFYDTTAVPTNLPPVPGWKDQNGDGQVNICENWKAIARPMMDTGRADEVFVERDDNRAPLFFTDKVTGRLRMKISPLVRFQPAYVGNDAGTPTSTTAFGSGQDSVPASTFTQSFGHWATPYRLYIYRSPLSDTVLKYYYWDGGAGNVLYREFDTSTNAVTLQRDTGFNPNNPRLKAGDAPELMLTVDPRRGLVNFAFPDSVVLYDSSGAPKPSEFNPADINARWARIAAAEGNPLSALRYIRLKGDRTTGNLPDGRRSPLAQIPNSRIIAGSETVYGPDQRPGPNYGREVMYRRVPYLSDRNITVGPNEYAISYTRQGNGTPPSSADPDVADMEDALSSPDAVIIFNSRADSSTSAVKENSLPESYTDTGGNTINTRIRVTYQLQNNLASDSVKADFLTRQMMTLAASVKLFDLNSGQPQQVSLTQRIRVRNLQR